MIARVKKPLIVVSVFQTKKRLTKYL